MDRQGLEFLRVAVRWKWIKRSVAKLAGQRRHKGDVDIAQWIVQSGYLTSQQVEQIRQYLKTGKAVLCGPSSSAREEPLPSGLLSSSRGEESLPSGLFSPPSPADRTEKVDYDLRSSPSPADRTEKVEDRAPVSSLAPDGRFGRYEIPPSVCPNPKAWLT